MKTHITELSGIDRPIIQGGMHYVGYAGEGRQKETALR